MIYENFGKSYQSLEIFRKLRKRSIKVLNCSENIRVCSEIFGTKTSETVQKCFSDVFMIFKKIFGKIFGYLWKCSKIIRKLSDVIGNFRNGS